uniref:Uncharacterized protein n=1 Tax=Rhodosorus marinus TaxID=101924 RepID=A0A7S2ZMZ6_9RHOD|mmetsp:Transcript_25428/g.100380  ORF Transcript_25428/g.100380 Transcript_25428/m.100380 type:complete len:316 (+) Transcript_25428:290-1237(+)
MGSIASTSNASASEKREVEENEPSDDREHKSVGVQAVMGGLQPEDGIFTEPPGISVEEDGETDEVGGRKRPEAEADQGLDEVELLRRRVLELESQVKSWQDVARDFLFGMALSPEMNSWYATILREYLQKALSEIPQVEKVNFTECSFPCVPSETPEIQMLKWEGMGLGEWNVEWAPKSWWIAFSVTGTQSPLPTRFNALVTISSVHLQGRLRTALPNDVSSVRFAFCSKPDLTFKTSFQLNWGRLPVPVRVSIESTVEDAIDAFIQNKLLLPNSYWVVMRRKRSFKVNDQEMLVAIKSAQRAREFLSPPPTPVP